MHRLKVPKGNNGHYTQTITLLGARRRTVFLRALIADLSDGTAFDTSIGWMSSTTNVLVVMITEIAENVNIAGREYDGEFCCVVAGSRQLPKNV